MHVLPVLGALEQKRKADPVVVIGVHSAKFDGEKGARRVGEAMARMGVAHPVVVDDDHRIWRGYAIRSWPTLVVVRPDGTLAAVAPGEADLDALDAFVQKVLDEARADGTLARRRFELEASPPPPEGALAFPGKLVALPDGRLAVSDSGHHRVLLLDGDGHVDRVVGSGLAGLADGSFSAAKLARPQGLAYDSDAGILYVADTGNHAIRELSLDRDRVRTIAGTGALGRGIPRGPVAARALPLRSPSDLAVAGDWLLIAMAGAHQVWALNRVDDTIGVLAGSGREAIDDGLFAKATFAQPSGLALAGARLYVADSETSAVRYLDLEKGEVKTLVGTGLFAFGDRDGPAAQALLQHPLGVSHGPAGLLVADSYNDKIKRVDETAGTLETWFAGEGELALREPSGLCQLADGRVVVADTNRHRLVVVSPDAAAARVLDVRGAEAPAIADRNGGPESVREIVLPTAHVGAGDATLRVKLAPPDGFDLAERSRLSLHVDAEGPFRAPEGDQGFEVQGPRRGVPILLRAQPGAAEGAIRIRVQAVVCTHGEAAACWPLGARYRIPVRVSLSGLPGAIEASLALPRPDAAPRG
jgi:sugar lactone lactonase YvrE